MYLFVGHFFYIDKTEHFFIFIHQYNNIVALVHKLVLESHVHFIRVFGWFKKLRLFLYVPNLKIDVVLKASRAVVSG